MYGYSRAHIAFRGRCYTQCFWRAVRVKTGYVYLSASKRALRIGTASPPTHSWSLILKVRNNSPHGETCASQVLPIALGFLHNTLENTLLSIKCFSGFSDFTLAEETIFTRTAYLQPCGLNVKCTPGSHVFEHLGSSCWGSQQVGEVLGGRALPKEVVTGVWLRCFIT